MPKSAINVELKLDSEEAQKVIAELNQEVDAIIEKACKAKQLIAECRTDLQNLVRYVNGRS